MWLMQKSIGHWCRKKFPDQDEQMIMAHMGEEQEELHDAVFAPFRPQEQMQKEVGEEIADNIILLLTLAEHLGINAVGEVRQKQRKNLKAKWELSPEHGYHKRVKE
jgi:NTP pyrophosphatase (non-canonical NTP hydrolase)